MEKQGKKQKEAGEEVECRKRTGRKEKERKKKR